MIRTRSYPSSSHVSRRLQLLRYCYCYCYCYCYRYCTAKDDVLYM